MTAASSTANDLLDLLAKLRSEEQELAKEIEDRLADVRRNIAAVETTLALLPRDSEAPKPINANGWAQKLHGLTQAGALVRIAQESGGVLHASEAKRIFIATRMAKGKPKHLAGHIYHMLKDDPRFMRIAPGAFKLVGPGEAVDSEGAFLQLA